VSQKVRTKRNTQDTQHTNRNSVCSDHPRRVFSGFYRCAKFGWNRHSSFDNMHVCRFHDFGLRTPIHASKIGGFDPLSGGHLIATPKRH